MDRAKKPASRRRLRTAGGLRFAENAKQEQQLCESFYYPPLLDNVRAAIVNTIRHSVFIHTISELTHQHILNLIPSLIKTSVLGDTVHRVNKLELKQ